MALTAAGTASLTGPMALQGRMAARGLQWWANEAGVSLRVRDDEGSASIAREAYRQWSGAGVDLLVGPYGSGLVRSVAPLVTEGGAVLWNHGGSADDLAQPLVASLPARASTYLEGAIELAAAAGLEEVVLAVGRGSFAGAVAGGAHASAKRLGLPVTQVPLATMYPDSLISRRAALLVVGTFQEDVTLVAALGDSDPGLIACVAAGLHEFGRRLGPAAEEVVGPVQWLPEMDPPDLGPSGADFARGYQELFGEPPDYVAAQAAAAGVLAFEAHRLGLRPGELRAWRTSTLLGRFALDRSWRQVGHRVRTIRWQGGRQVPVG